MQVGVLRRACLLPLLLALACGSRVAGEGEEAGSDELGTGETDTGATDGAGTDETDTGEMDSADTGETDTGETGPPTSCEGVGVSNLEGVCIWFPEPGGLWLLEEAAAGIEIPYYVIVEADVPDVVPVEQDIGGCQEPGPSGLITFERLTGNEQGYCLCDLGLCGPPGGEPAGTVMAGEWPASFSWTGVNWSGPSDTNNPPGPPFPPGEYTLEVSAIGTVGGVDFEVRNTFNLSLTEVLTTD